MLLPVDKNQQKIITHHGQINKAKAKTVALAQHRQFSFEINRASIKIKVEMDRQYLVSATLMFLIGVSLVFYCIIYVVGAILYG